MAMTETQALVRRFHDAAFNQLDPSIVDELLAPDYVRHDPAFPGGANRAVTKRLIATLREGVPDVQHAWDDQRVAGDQVITRWSATGTHTGPLFGHQPRQAGTQLTMTGIFIDRVADGRIVESWSEWDQLSLLRQIGVDAGSAPAAREVGR